MWAAVRSKNRVKEEKKGMGKLSLLPVQKVLKIEYLQSSSILSRDLVTGRGNKSDSWKRRTLKSQIMSILWDENVGEYRADPMREQLSLILWLRYVKHIAHVYIP